MSTRWVGQTKPASVAAPVPARAGVLQRKCACGGTAGPAGECAACRRKRQPGGMLQTKLRVNQPGDRYEREADRVAEQVMRMPEPAGSPLPISFVHRQSLLQQAEGKAGSEQTKEATGQNPDVSARKPGAISQAGSQGCSLPLATRHLFESRFGYDFSQVRIHADSRAAQAAHMINARAFTIGHDIFFDRGEYCPHTESGRKLIAHELAHTIQQTNTSFSSDFQSAPTMIQRNERGGRGRRSALAELIARLQREGRLNPAVLPEDVDPIPPLPITREELERVGGTEVVAAGAAPLLSGAARSAPTARTAAQVVTRTGRVLTVIEGGASTSVGTEAAVGAGLRASSLLRFGTPIAAFLTVLLTPSSTAPAWMDTVSQITGLPYATPEEYRWERNLTGRQIDYLRQQAQPTPASRPRPQPQPAPREEDRRQQECFEQHPFALPCEWEIDRDEVVVNFLMREGYSFEDLGDCQGFSSFGPNTIGACDGAPGEVWHCEVAGGNVVSVFGCLCCRPDGTTGFEWRGPHWSVNLSGRGR